METMLEYKTYAENIRVAAKKKGLNIRQLATGAQYSYEHIRQIWFGNTPKRRDAKLTVSRECNDLLCQMLGLPADAMFALAEREKYSQKHGYAPIELHDPQGIKLVELWNEMDRAQREALLTVGRGFVGQLAAAS